MTPAASVAELADQILANDGCHMFFAGPTDQNLKAKINLYNVHYAGTHTIGVKMCIRDSLTVPAFVFRV